VQLVSGNVHPEPLLLVADNAAVINAATPSPRRRSERRRSVVGKREPRSG
jgi:hypothetical protein